MFDQQSNSSSCSNDSLTPNDTSLNHNQIIKSIITFLKKNTIYDIINQSSSIVMLNHELTIEDLFEAIDSNNADIFLIQDPATPEAAVATFTTSDLIEFLYRDLWCNMEKRRNKLKELLDHYGTEINQDALRVFQHQTASIESADIGQVEAMMGMSKVDHYFSRFKDFGMPKEKESIIKRANSNKASFARNPEELKLSEQEENNLNMFVKKIEKTESKKIDSDEKNKLNSHEEDVLERAHSYNDPCIKHESMERFKDSYDSFKSPEARASFSDLKSHEESPNVISLKKKLSNNVSSDRKESLARDSKANQIKEIKNDKKVEKVENPIQKADSTPDSMNKKDIITSLDSQDRKQSKNDTNNSTLHHTNDKIDTEKDSETDKIQKENQESKSLTVSDNIVSIGHTKEEINSNIASKSHTKNSKEDNNSKNIDNISVTPNRIESEQFLIKDSMSVTDQNKNLNLHSQMIENDTIVNNNDENIKNWHFRTLDQEFINPKQQDNNEHENRLSSPGLTDNFEIYSEDMIIADQLNPVKKETIVDYEVGNDNEEKGRYNNDKEFMDFVVRSLTVSQAANLSQLRRKQNQQKKNVIQARLERDEIEKAVHHHFNNQEEGSILEHIIQQRRKLHRFPKGIQRLHLDDSLFKACEAMFFSQVHHLVVGGIPENTEEGTELPDIQGIIDQRMIMKHISKFFRIDLNLHSWLISEKGEESLFKKSLRHLNIGIMGTEKINQVYLDDTIYTAIKNLNKNMLTSIPIQVSAENKKLVGFLEPEDVRFICTSRDQMLSPGMPVRDLFRSILKRQQENQNSSEDCRERMDEDRWEERSMDLEAIHLRGKSRVLQEKDSLYTLMEFLGQGQVRGVQVNSAGELYGIVHLTDIFNFFVYKEIQQSVTDELQDLQLGQNFKMSVLED